MKRAHYLRTSKFSFNHDFTRARKAALRSARILHAGSGGIPAASFWCHFQNAPFWLPAGKPDLSLLLVLKKLRIMSHEGLLFNLAVCLGVALLCGYVATRIRLSPIVGYLFAGIICGPFTPGFVVEPGIAEQMADIGVVLLMFGTGLHFNFRELYAVRNVAVPGAVIQSLVATAAVAGAAHLAGLTWWQAVVSGLAFSVASTAVLARMLTDYNQLSSPAGRLAIGWLVVEDVFTVVVLVLLPMFAAQQTQQSMAGDWPSLAGKLGAALGKLVLLMVLVGILGMRLVPWLLGKVANSREMFNLTVPAVAMGIAWMGWEFSGVSLALGSFLAGVVAGQSKLVERVEETVLPLRDLFTALFFLSIGTLVNPHYVVTHPVRLLFALFVILLIKPLTAFVLALILRQPLHTALVVAVGLAQVGEFSFILIRDAHKLNILPPDAGHQLVAAAMISIMLNPFLFRYLPRIEQRLGRLKWLKNRCG
jgi:CPA2 family monovalent cation:H+ antiporter-2